MTVRVDVAELLRAGYGDRTIARQAGVTIGTVTRARTALGLPKARGGYRASASAEDVFWRRAKPVDGGHYEWISRRNGTPSFAWGGRSYSVYRVAYQIRHGVEPTGYVHMTCDHPGCVAPDHTADRSMGPRRPHHTGSRTRTPNSSRDDVVRLIRAGHSNRQVGQLLRTDPRRVAAIRAELGLPRVVSKALTFEDRWKANTQTVDGGHIRWTGRVRDGGTPFLLHNGVDSSVRRVAFERLHGRRPVGPVLPGCGRGDCVRPDHLEDRPMRAALAAQYAAIFGAAS
ncbi:hypothetical protein [Streptomyces sp. NPDC002132]|uniref:hypothetical protein n=1 Tax=unclassified Streptomyces TaxID=2593676 RepID=UPI00332A1DC6